MNNLQRLVSQAKDHADKLNHEYITLEHFAFQLMQEASVKKFLESKKIDYKKAIKELEKAIQAQNSKRPIGSEVKSTSTLKEYVTHVHAQNVMLQSSDPSIELMFLILLMIKDSYAVFLLEDMGLVIDTSVRELEETILSSRGRPTINATASKKGDNELAFCVNINEYVKKDKIKTFGREKEIATIFRNLARKNKPNVLMAGDPGVGKTQIIYGMAQQILSKKCPKIFLDYTIFSLDMTTLMAGTKYRGDVEERIKQLLDSIENRKDVILFIDEFHMTIGNSSSGSMDIANMLKPYLVKNTFKVIGATTDQEKRKFLEKNAALMRRFYALDIVEPTPEDTKQILMHIKDEFESFHKVKFTDDAIPLAVDLAVKHIYDRFLPDKAIDVLDLAAARMRVSKTKTDIDTLLIENEVCEMVGHDIRAKIDEAPMDVEVELNKNVFGQEKAVKALAEAYYVSKAGLREHSLTIGTYIFNGPTGTGKTELSEQMARILGIPLIKFDMSEYQEKHTVSKLIGSPPGYVGYGDGAAGEGLLISKISKTPHCVLLLDEVEKAHPDVFSLLLQIMDKGKLTSSNGKEVNFSKVLMIMTTNLGQASMEKQAIGFGDGIRTGDDVEATNQFFTPEFRNRLDGIVSFNKLSKEIMIKIVNKFLEQLRAQLADKGHKIIFSEPLKEMLAAEGFSSTMGARPLRRLIFERIRKPIAKEILFNKTDGNILVDYINKDVTIKFVESAKEKDHVEKDSE